MYPRTLIRVMVPLALCALLSTLTACKDDSAQQGGGGYPPTMVSLYTVTAATVPVNFTYVGQAEGSRDAEVHARVSGILLKRDYTEGTMVKAGAPLFTIDPAPFNAALAQAEAEVTRSEAQLAQATRDEARLKPLLADHAVPQKDYDDAASAVDYGHAAVASAKAKLASARLDVDYSHVTAPISGVSGRSAKSEGSLVAPGADSLLTTVTQIDPIYINFSMADDERMQLANAAKNGSLILPPGGKFSVALTLSDGNDYDKTGQMTFSDVHVNRDTGTIDARATLANPDGQLLPGQFVRVHLTGATRPNAITVPQSAVMDGPTGKFVYVIAPMMGQNGKPVPGKDGKPMSIAAPRPVTMGEWVSTPTQPNAWIVTQGLKAGDKIIVDGVAQLRPGAPVDVMPAAAAHAASH